MTEPTKYESYIDTGNEWLGAIPSSWNTILLSQAVYQVKNKNSELQEKNLLSLSYGKIKRKPIDANGGLLPESFDGYNIIETNDIVLRLTDLQNDHRSLRVGISSERGIITSAYITLRPRKQSAAKYLYYLLHTFDIRKGFYGMGSGVRQGLNYDEVKRLKLPLPTESEQKAISDYLDNKLSRVDTLISEAKTSIEEYKAWKASIIFEAVTKGLDPNVEMKDSGVEWIGKIPSCWNMMRIKDCAVFMPKVDFSSIRKDDMITFTPMDCIKNGYFENKGNVFSEIEGSYTPYAEGDIVFAKVTPCFENGNAAIMENLFSNVGLGSSELFVLRAKNIDIKYLFYFIRNKGFIQAATSTMTGTGGLKRVSSDFVKNAPIPIPGKEEQKKISNYLDKQCKRIDDLVSEKESLISDLESYKKSLIFEVVTGKRRV